MKRGAGKINSELVKAKNKQPKKAPKSNSFKYDISPTNVNTNRVSLSNFDLHGIKDETPNSPTKSPDDDSQPT